MSTIYRRPDLAGRMARQLLHPGVLDEGLRSGLFLSGLRRTGKTTFLLHDLVPALEAEGAVVIYVDLWSDAQAGAQALVSAAVRRTLADLQSPGSALLQRLTALKSAELAVLGFKFGFKVETVGAEGGTTLARALTDLVDQARADVVLIVDEVQHALATEQGEQLLLALKAARDAINTRPDTPGHFVFIGTGSHRALVRELTARRNQAFAGATSVDYPVLDRPYVEHLLARLVDEGAEGLPTVDATLAAFRTLGHRPEELLKALRQLLRLRPRGHDPDGRIAVIAATLRSAAADLELHRVEQLGGLAEAVFARVAAAEGEARGLFSAEAIAGYAKALGREVRVDEVQPVVNGLLAANLVMRRGHGLYGVTDPYVQEVWQERRDLERPL